MWNFPGLKRGHFYSQMVSSKSVDQFKLGTGKTMETPERCPKVLVLVRKVQTFVILRFIPCIHSPGGNRQFSLNEVYTLAIFGAL